MGLRPTHGNENATVRHRRINGLWRAFNRAVLDTIVLWGPVHALRRL
jgi:hypothetical protein